MLSKEIVEDKVVFVNSINQISDKPIILGVIMACLMTAVVMTDRADAVPSDIMLANAGGAVKCSKTYNFGWRFKYIRKGYFQGSCPSGWTQIR